MARREREERQTEREERQTLPGIAEVRLRADADTAEVVLEVLRAHFTVTTPRGYSGDRWYFHLDTGNTAPDPDGP
ncbi:hypothetical protein [Streptomyces achromogenes]|uniref:hypothetical protein n=1 Tax=Streptomyces achromogenes TaxID=67255 RepID=UPI00343ADC65